MKNKKEIETNIKYWENEVKEALKNNNMSKAITCKILVNRLRRDLEDE